MKKPGHKDQTDILRKLPPIDTLLQTSSAIDIKKESGARQLTFLARTATELLRAELLLGEKADDREELLRRAEIHIRQAWAHQRSLRIHRLINATGVIIHTNLGRAPLSEKAKDALINEASGYCNLEYNIRNGKRAKRGAGAEFLLAQLTGAESALIVNNCAAAALLVLTALGNGGEAIISRGELVEIGGDFRVPDVMEQSGTRLVEVGTTNRTKLADYEEAITENTRLLLKVHPSNYRIIGFTETPGISSLSKLAKESDVLFYEDAGSGALIDLSDFGLSDEPLISRSIAEGADVVTFSGDKLLGGPQAGLIVGREDVIRRIRKHPLYRALRVSKLTYAALEATFDSFITETALENIPVLKMLSLTREQLRERAEDLVSRLRERLGDNSYLDFELMTGRSVIGGGSAPAVKPETCLIAISGKDTSAAQLDQHLRSSQPGVISRIIDDRVVLDLRTVSEEEEPQIIEVLAKLDRNI
ncbi:MAG: L-seryl-tRNA(Sec) selenium transferase [Acidobacteria bacterium]|nr:L-seryl-tRNA(Sec) selenium transferase [Acidobacteriota bacterium]